MKVIGYNRVSTNEQAEDGVGRKARAQRIREYCKARRWQLIEIVRDDGYSPKDLKRPGLRRSEVLRHRLPVEAGPAGDRPESVAIGIPSQHFPHFEHRHLAIGHGASFGWRRTIARAPVTGVGERL
jgi:hypothetical protein